ncbi:SAVED domain-containing protein [Neobacillus cucumis]|uniref:SAVED domain-containing protein n=1 Tax=Neobacillus cucumis TaxID=1740721 RepID=UPI001962F0C5|nr:SAVED domain-containing protein [Neobacillus cucumis]MBM7651750.1 fluoride ion exporter CrcB/FEX [Neobacillus cucumis]
MTLNTITWIIAAFFLIGGLFLIIKHFAQKQKEESLSYTFITIGLELITTSFGTFDDKVFAFLTNTQVNTNYVQMVVGGILSILGVFLLLYIKSRIYVININGYSDYRIEKHYKDLNLSAFEFKEREIDFIRPYRKGMDSTVADEIQDIITEKMATFKAESSDKSRAYTGIAPIPFIFVAGKLLGKEKIERYFEYDKFKQSYYPLTICKKKRKPYTSLELTPPLNQVVPLTAYEVVLAVSITQQITNGNLSQFTCPIIHLAITHPTDNTIKYTDQLESYTHTIYQLLIDGLPKRFSNLTKIHLVYAGQSCLAFEVGKLLDDHRMVEVISYQFTAQSTPKYPWGIVLNGNRKGTYIES